MNLKLKETAGSSAQVSTDRCQRIRFNVAEILQHQKLERTTLCSIFGLRFHFYGAKMRLRRILRP